MENITIHLRTPTIIALILFGWGVANYLKVGYTGNRQGTDSGIVVFLFGAIMLWVANLSVLSSPAFVAGYFSVATLSLAVVKHTSVRVGELAKQHEFTSNYSRVASVAVFLKGIGED